MPLYKYKCNVCGNIKEKNMSVSEMEGLKEDDWFFKCEYCSTGFYEMIFTKAPSVHFKGDNFTKSNSED